MSQSRKSRNDNEIPLQTVEEHWRRIFAKYDEDNDGRIPVKEFADILRRFQPRDIPHRVVEQIVQQSDLDKDSFITYPEFLKMIETPEGHQLAMGWLNLYIYHTVVPRKRRRVVPADDFPDGQYEDQYSCYPPAVCMLIISIFEIIAYIWDHVKSDSNYGHVAEVLMYNPHRRKEAWRFLSYMFVHSGVYHLFLNLLVQIMLGIPLEMVHGWWRVSIIYLSGVVAGSLLTSVITPYIFLVGASGGVYSIITAHLATLIMNWSEMQYAIWQLLFFILLCSSDVGNALYVKYVLNQKSEVGHIAHFGGAMAGLLVGLYILRNLEVRSWEKKIWWSAVIVYCFLLFGTIMWNIFVPNYYPVQYV